MPFSMLKRHKCKKKNTCVFFRTPCQPSSVSHYIFCVNCLFFLHFRWFRITSGIIIESSGPPFSYVHCTALIFKILFCLKATDLYSKTTFWRQNNFFRSAIEAKLKNILKIWDVYILVLEETKSLLNPFCYLFKWV